MLEQGLVTVANRSGRDRSALDPTLNWLETYLAVVHHFDFALAGSEFGISRRAARDRVENLQLWLRKTLIMEDQISIGFVPEGAYGAGDGDDFVVIAAHILSQFNRHLRAPKTMNHAAHMHHRGNVSLWDLELFLTFFSDIISESGVTVRRPNGINTRADVAYCLGVKESAISRSLSKISQGLGDQVLFYGQGSSIIPSRLGIEFKVTADDIVYLMYMFRSRQKPKQASAIKESVIDIRDERALRMAISRRRIHANIVIDRARRSHKKSAVRNSEITAAQKALNVLDQVETLVNNWLGPSNIVSPIDVDVEFLGKTKAP